MRSTRVLAGICVLMIGACGGESAEGNDATTSTNTAATGAPTTTVPPVSSLESYVETQQALTDELQALGVRVIAGVEAVANLETGEIIDGEGLVSLLRDIASELNSAHARLMNLAPEPEIADAHNAFVDAAGDRLEQWERAADQASEIKTLEELVALTSKTPAFTAACENLENAVSTTGLLLDLDCE